MMIPMRKRAAQMGFAWRILAATSLFAIGTMMHPESMSPVVMGDLAYSIELEAWIAGFIGGALLVLYGITINGKMRWSPVLRIAGYGFLAFMLTVLFWSAWTAPSGVALWSWGVPFIWCRCAYFMAINVSDAALRWRNAGH